MLALHRFLEDRRGITVTEFALVAPAMLLVAFSLVDLGRIGLATASLTRGAQEAARYASLRGAKSAAPATAEQVSAVARSRIYGLDPGTVSVNVAWAPDNRSGSSVTVATSSTFRVLLGLLPIGPVTLDGRSTLVVQ